VQGFLSKTDVGLEVEIVFPVANEAITTSSQTSGGQPPELPGGLHVVPGPAGGEGCSAEGGCAACPYMKMNSLAALERVCERVGSAGEATLVEFRPRGYKEQVCCALYPWFDFIRTVVFPNKG
jgi:quinolinate synthase